MTTAVRELALIESLTRGLARSPRQTNGLQESDAELLSLGTDTTLAVTTDTVAEEIAAGLYADPWLAGWMAVMVNFSDIAAVGAEPLGIVMAETFPAGLDAATLSRIQSGINDACRTCGTYVLGGDTNTGDALQLTGTALGLISSGKPLTRKGIRPGDLVYSTGPLGGGNAFAALVLAHAAVVVPYKPIARVREGSALRGVATACMDTSDGLFATLDQLARVNGVGFALDHGWETHLDPAAVACGKATGLSSWLFLAGPHGEFELIFAVPGNDAAAHGNELVVAGTVCQRLGRATADKGITIPGIGSFTPDHRAAIRNLDPPGKGNLSAYIAEMLNSTRQ